MPRHDVNKDATAETRRRGAEKAAESKRRKKEEDRALLAELRRDHLDDAIEKLSAIATKAADAIEELLGADSEAVKLRAALGVLEILDAAELRELSDRLSRLEEIAMRIKAPGVEKDQHRFISACGSRDDAMHSLRHYQVRLRQSHRLRYSLPRLLFATAKPLLLILAIAALFFLAASRL